MRPFVSISGLLSILKKRPSPGVLLLFAVVLSLILANSSLEPAVQSFLNRSWGWETAQIQLRYSTLAWINDGLMALFFLLVGLEIKREIVEGELASPKKAALPILAALGGAVVPSLIYVLFNKGLTSASGWGIPMATDIAFAVAVLGLLGSRVPLALKVFLTALAIVDDLMAILVIALFYAQEIHAMYLFYAAILLVLLGIFNRMGVRRLVFYLVPGLGIWYFIHHSGIHATIAGVLVAMMIPNTPYADKTTPLMRLETQLHFPIHYLILPVFAWANTAIRIDGDLLTEIVSPLGLGVFFGLLFGKPLGITLISWLACQIGIAQKPKGISWTQVIGVGLIAGMGFTMSIFIAILSFPQNQGFTNIAKLSVLITSFLAGILGFLVLLLLSKKKENKTEVS